jgi:hypothetical protein
MKNIIIVIVFLITVIACKETKKEIQESTDAIVYSSFGDKITDEHAVSKELMAKKFKELKKGDTINVKFTSSINEVCKKKGCWMKLDLGNKEESMVKFKDYGFFMPLDSDTKEVVVEGRAFVTETTVDELKHYAKDAGETEEEIAKITEPKFTYAFEADGVLMKE